MLIQPTERAEHDRRVNNMSIRKVVAGLLITAGIRLLNERGKMSIDLEKGEK